MADQSLAKAKVMGTPGVDYTVEYLPEAASQSFKDGELVYLVNGKVTVCASDATSIAGIAMEDATGTTDTLIPVAIPIMGKTKIRMNVYHSTPASAVTAVTQVGTRYAVLVASNKAHCDIEDTSNLAVIVVNIVRGVDNAVGDQYGLVDVMLLGIVSQLTGQTNA